MDILHEKGSCVYETQLKSKDGKFIPVEISSSLFELDGRSMIFSDIRNIEERLRYEEEKQAQDRMLIQQSKLAEIGEMMGSIAHQWKQPLNIIGFMIQDLEESYLGGEINKDFIRDFIKQSMDQIKYMAATIEDFRSFFKPGHEHKNFSPEKSVRDMLRLISAQMKNHSIETEITAPTGDSLYTAGPENEFKQVLLNLFNNAKDAVAERKHIRPDLTGSLKIRINRQDDLLVMEIEDNGGGIPVNILPTVFHPYVSSKGEKGTGIGLYMARQIIEKKLHGTIDASNTDQGALFTIRLPLSVGNA
jgi:C4-dicarboxylate-specific signal transduction histidine kinase